MAASHRRGAVTLRQHLLAHCYQQDRHTVTGLLRCAGQYYDDWSKDYRVYSSQLDSRGLFEPIIQKCCQVLEEGAPVILAVDDSLIPKTGRTIPQASYHRDPLGPKFHTNLVYALRFVQLSMAVPDRQYVRGHRMIPVAAKLVEKAGKEATDVERKAHGAGSQSLILLKEFSQTLSKLGYHRRPVYLCGDAHYTTETVLRNLDPGMVYIGRTRRDTALYEPIDYRSSGPGRPKAYGCQLATPEQLQKDSSVPWSTAHINRGGKKVLIRYKRITRAKWKPAGAKTTVQVIVVAPMHRGRRVFHDGKVPKNLQAGKWERRKKFCSYRTRDLRNQLYQDAVGAIAKFNKTGFCRSGPM